MLFSNSRKRMIVRKPAKQNAFKLFSKKWLACITCGTQKIANLYCLEIMDFEYGTCLCVLSEDNFLRKYFLHPLCKDFEVDLKEKFEKLQQNKNKQYFDNIDFYVIMNMFHSLKTFYNRKHIEIIRNHIMLKK